MATEVIMPQLGESVVEGTVTKWLKSESETVDEFEPLVEINTDKVDTEVPAPASGTVLRQFVAEGETVKAGTLLALIGEPGEVIPEVPGKSENGEVAATVQAATPPSGDGAAARTPVPEAVAASKPAPSGTGQRTLADLGFISPVVAKIAADRGIDLTMVHGTGQGGRITKKDLLAFAEGAPEAAAEQPAGKPSGQGRPAAAPWEEPASGELFRPTEELFGKAEPPGRAAAGPVAPIGKAAAATPTASPSSPQAGVPEARGTSELIKLDAVRSRIAEHMLRSKHTSPHVTTVMEADMGRVIAHRTANKASFERDGTNLTFTAYFVAAAVEALKAVPIVNSSWTDDGVLLHKQVNIGVAVSLGDRGLIVPVVKNADQLSLLAIARSVNDLAERARSRELQPDEVQGGTFTITNHGVSGSLMATPIINQPQCAILGVGVMQKRAVVVEAAGSTGETADTIAIRPMVYLTLTFDHRIIDGAIGDHFLAALVRRLQSWD